MGTAVPGGAGSAVRLQLAEDQALVVGRHVHLEAESRGSGVHTGTGAAQSHHLPSSPGTARWPGPAPAAAPCPAAPRRDCCGEGGTGHTRGQPPPKQPQLSPAGGLHSGLPYLEGPRWEGASCSCRSRGPTERTGWAPRSLSPPAPSYLCLRLRSKSTLLWGLIWPSTA